ncbi:DUF1254 domain-containing protein [Bradyrhizobium sp. SYSU BS000235]|uniref:DUF1254 domain-containing protein n=1 Tax=Bradyrhizobium sp. SYSU BS000235 TaxID=3411332 RepID=UPI003C719709
MFTRRLFTAGSLLAAPLLIRDPLHAQLSEMPPVAQSEAEQIAIDAYIYGYSLITTEVTRVQMTNVEKAETLRSPMGQFTNVRRYPPGDYRGVSAPNADTLYSLVWLDVGPEPVVFSHPDMGKRFYLFPMYSLWMPVFAVPSRRTAGGAAATYLLTGPGWKGKVPSGMQHIKSPTRYFVILGRTYADGSDADFKAVNALQDKYAVVPLSAYGKPYTPPPAKVDPNPGFSMTDKPQAVIDAMDTQAYFNMMTRLMGEAAPPAPEDAPMVARMAKIGLVPGKSFDMSKLDAVTQASLKDVPKKAWAKIAAAQTESGYLRNGWHIPSAAGAYGTNYLARALVAAFGWPANLAADAVYPYAMQDGAGRRLSGANKYTLTFAKGQTPPVEGFWSITMYIIDGGWWFNPNPLNKFTVSPRDKPVPNPDGSLTLYFQNESPGKDKEANWLPAPKGDFLVMMRMYWPRSKPPSILPPGSGTWEPPPVMQADRAT